MRNLETKFFKKSILPKETFDNNSPIDFLKKTMSGSFNLRVTGKRIGYEYLKGFLTFFVKKIFKSQNFSVE